MLMSLWQFQKALVRWWWLLFVLQILFIFKHDNSCHKSITFDGFPSIRILEFHYTYAHRWWIEFSEWLLLWEVYIYIQILLMASVNKFLYLPCFYRSFFVDFISIFKILIFIFELKTYELLLSKWFQSFIFKFIAENID